MGGVRAKEFKNCGMDNSKRKIDEKKGVIPKKRVRLDLQMYNEKWHDVCSTRVNTKYGGLFQNVNNLPDGEALSFLKRVPSGNDWDCPHTILLHEASGTEYDVGYVFERKEDGMDDVFTLKGRYRVLVYANKKDHELILMLQYNVNGAANDTNETLKQKAHA